MTTTALPASSQSSHVEANDRIASAVRQGLLSRPKRLPPWLFYDEAGSRLFDAITGLPEYYLTLTERQILSAHAAAIVSQAADGLHLRIAELGAGSADKTRLLLSAAIDRQGSVLYEPVDVSATALDVARQRIESEIPGVTVAPRVEDYTQGLVLDPLGEGERRLLLYIGSSIGNFEPHEASRLLERVRAGLSPGDSLLLGVDLVKDESILLAAYNDAAGITAAFNRNMLTRLNRDLAADFAPEAFAHRAIWNAAESRIEMHLESREAQRIRLAAIDLEVAFAPGESIHTENSYKYAAGHPEALLAEAGFLPTQSWSDKQGWFAVCLAQAV